jgi:hypothetical protein
MECPENSITIHLYRYEEVVSSLIFSVIQRKYTESVFWGLELYDSGMMDGLDMKLLETWIQYAGFGTHCYSVLLEIINMNKLDRDQWADALYRWSRAIPDSTVAHLLIRGSVAPTSWKPRFPHSEHYETVEAALHDCIKRGKALEAWILSRAIGTEELWHIFNKHIGTGSYRQSMMETLKGFKNNISEQVTLAACLVLVTIPENFLEASIAEPKAVATPAELLNAINEWDQEESIRKRRCFPIRPEAITYTCERSSLPMTESVLNEIQCGLEQSMKSSPCWQIILEDYMDDNTKWKNDIYKEMFYDTYFPGGTDDIPDEWPSKDKELSHGRGLGKSTQIAIKQHVGYMLRNKSCLGAYKCSLDLPSSLPPSLQWHTIYSGLKGACKKSLDSQLPFTSICTKFEFT